MQAIVSDMETVGPNARLFNYTNPVNIIADAVSHHTDIPIVSLCEGPIVYPRLMAAVVDLDPDKLDDLSP